MDYDYEFPKNNLSVKYFILETGKEKLDLSNHLTNLEVFMDTFSPIEFPVFSHDNNYMDIIAKLIQDKLICLRNSYKKIDSIFDNYENQLTTLRKVEGNSLV